MPNSVTVLGLGNILMSDEGVGVHLLNAVRDSRRWPAEVLFVDGGAGGLSLLNVIEEARSMVVFDAAEMGLSVGEYRMVTPEQLTAESTSDRLSMHDVSFAETLDLCGRFFRCPEIVRILAIQPHTLSPGRGLSAELRYALPRLVAAGTALIEEVANLPSGP